MKIALVFLGGGMGAALRWLLGQSLASNHAFPIGTFSVNMIGCFLIGILGYYAISGLSQNLILLLMIGFLGGFTTFSSFGLDLVNLLKEGNGKIFWTYLLSSNVLGVFLVYLGYQLANSLNL